MLTVEQLLDAGIILLDEQIDYLHHPEGRLAVAIYGVQDPDRLYITGPTDMPTLYQVAPEGEPADERGMSAVVLPIVIEGEDQEELARIYLDHVGDIDACVPVVLGTICDPEPMHHFLDDSTPLCVAVWDLWPIDRYDLEVWTKAAERAVLRSAIPSMFSYIDTYSNGIEHELTDEDLEDEDFEVLERIRQLEQSYQGRADQDDEMAGLIARREEIRLEKGTIGERIMNRWLQQMTHPVTGEIDAQMPPVDLPPEQAAIWRSLQSLSWRNWALLESKGLEIDGDVFDGSRFVQSNRRLCPWY